MTKSQTNQDREYLANLETVTRVAQEMIPEDRYTAFMKALEKPARIHPRLQRLFNEPSVLESPEK